MWVSPAGFQISTAVAVKRATLCLQVQKKEKKAILCRIYEVTACIRDSVPKQTTKKRQAWCKRGIKESCAQWERQCLGMCACEANAIGLILCHRGTPQKWAHKLWVFSFCLREIRGWFGGFAVWSLQPTMSPKSVGECRGAICWTQI